MSPTRSTTAAVPDDSTATTASTTSPPAQVRAVKDPARVAFVGAGPGDAGLLTVRACEFLGRRRRRSSSTRSAARSSSPALRAATDVEIVDAGHGEHGQPLTHAIRAKLVVKAAKRSAPHHGGLVVRLMDGDPATFNGLAEEALACRKAGIAFEVVPGVSAGLGRARPTPASR